MKKLKEDVLDFNKKLLECGLVIFTWGNLSAIDREKKIIAIKPSGVDYDIMVPEDISIVDLEGRFLEGKKPSVDLPTHIELYKEFKDIGCVIHTHSLHATAFAQAGKEIECLGTTHADHFYGNIPVTRMLNEKEMDDYEKNTGKLIIETFKGKKLDPLHMPACLVAGHGPFVWGKTIKEAFHNAVVLEHLAKKNLMSYSINKDAPILPKHIQEKHFQRKHGKNAYYGQK
jgi:L-ribulose-5-phosphate 4-epimerase